MQGQLGTMALPANTHKTVTGLLVVGVLAWVVELLGTSFLTKGVPFLAHLAQAIHQMQGEIKDEHTHG